MAAAIDRWTWCIGIRAKNLRWQRMCVCVRAHARETKRLLSVYKCFIWRLIHYAIESLTHSWKWLVFVFWFNGSNRLFPWARFQWPLLLLLLLVFRFLFVHFPSILNYQIRFPDEQFTMFEMDSSAHFTFEHWLWLSFIDRTIFQ